MSHHLTYIPRGALTPGETFEPTRPAPVPSADPVWTSEQPKPDNTPDVKDTK